MDQTTNSLNWFEIPADDLGRAKKFYEGIFDITMEEMEMPGMAMASFPYAPESGKAAGCVAKSEMHKPSAEGAVIYLNANPNMDGVVAKIESNGGKVVMPKTKISDDIGYMAFFMDTEGNKVALHSQE